MKSFVRASLPSLLAAAFSLPALATNGMNMEGYGPVAAGMGGAGMAYDTGTAALMNNPATLALMQDGTRVDLAAGLLGPHVKANGQDSGGTAYVMPAFGIAHKQNDLTFGFGIFAQGGMGTEYDNASFYNGLRSMGGAVTTDPGFRNRSEVGVGRALLPVAWKASEELTIGGSIDFVWATMDLQMLIDGTHFQDMMGGTGRFGNATPNAAFQATLGGLGADVGAGYFDFSDNSDFSGAAKGHGWAGKIGATYKANSALTLGAVYHSKTHMSDLSAKTARMVMTGTNGATLTILPGTITVKDFEWPDMIGLGLSYKPDERWQFVADYRRIGWKSVMKQFHMFFDGGASGTMDMTMRQEWKNQHVLMLGTAYKYTPQLTVRAGINIANNPVPEATTNPLFPAIVKNHLTGGFGYAFSPKSSLDFSATYAPKVKVTNDYGYLTGTSNANISHGQINAQIMYSMFF
jgi:long-chain fatty acid transport protein